MPDHPAGAKELDRAQLCAEIVVHSQGWEEIEPLVQKMFRYRFEG